MASLASRLTYVFAIVAALTVCAGHGGRHVPRESTFPLHIESVHLHGRTLSVKYVLTNDSRDAVWAACPAPECAFPAVVAGRIDGTAAYGAVIQVSSRLIPPPSGPVLFWPQKVPFRRIDPGDTRWEATYEVPASVAMTSVPKELELAIGVLPCPDADFLPALLPTQITCPDLSPAECDSLRQGLPVDGLNYATPSMLSCGRREQGLLEFQRISRATHEIIAELP